MGGKAIKKVETRRYTRKEFEDLRGRIKWFSRYSGGRVHIVDFFFEKDSFGDVDVLVEMTHPEAAENILKNVAHNEVVRNGTVISFDINGNFQCDLIKVPTEDWDFAKAFYAYNDLGLILGRMARRLGFTYGFDGLKYKVYSEDKTTKLGEIFLSKNPKEAFELFELDWTEFEKGFNNMDEVFDYVFKSRFATQKIFERNFQNSANRRRDAKRPSLELIENYVEKNKDRIPYDVDESFLDGVLDMLNQKFPKAKLKYTIWKMNKEYEREKEAAEIFSGADAMECVKGLEGAELGKMLNGFKSCYTDFTGLRLREGKEKMKELFRSYYLLCKIEGA